MENTMRELNFKEIEDVSGGIAPVIAVGLVFAGATAAGLGVSWAINYFW